MTLIGFGSPMLNLVGQAFAASAGGVAAATWATGGANKNPSLTLSNGNLTVTPIDNATYEWIRASREAAGTFHFDYVPPSGSASNFIVGIDDGVQDFSTYANIIGYDDADGVGMQLQAGSWYILRNGGVTQGPISAPWTGGSTVRVQCDKAAGTVAFLVNGSQIGVNETSVSFTHWYGMFGSKSAASAGTADFSGY